MLTDSVMGHFYSGPSLFEVGESSLAGEGILAQVLSSIEACPKARHQSLELGASDRCAKPLVEADGPFFVGTSSDELLVPLGKTVGLLTAGTWSV